MQRIKFRLFKADRSAPRQPDATKEYQQAVRLLEGFLAAGWTLSRVDEGHAGGLPAGRFTVIEAEARETITFRLDARSLEEFRVAVRKIGDLPAGRWVLTGAELDTTEGVTAGVVLLAESGGAARAARGRAPAARAPRPAPLGELGQALRSRPSAYKLTVQVAIEALRAGTGEAAEQVRSLLGEEYFALLSDMARRVPGKRGGKRPKAWVLPGIMGSSLGTKKSLLGLVNYNDVIWIDPVDLRLGRLDALALTPRGRPRLGTRSVGVLYLFYLRLKLALDLAGFDADFYDYDWRRPVRELGAELAAALKEQKAPVCLAAHSMGGVISRAALKAGAKNVARLIMIGTPNHGSFVPAQALRAAYPFIKSLSLLFKKDLVTTTSEVFATFPGLYDLMADPATFHNFPLLDPKAWPSSPPNFRPDLLEAAAGVQDLLQPADERFHLICGVNQDTMVDVRVEDGEFVFLQTKDGDGTVPRLSAELAHCPTLYVEGSHGMLPNYGQVCDLTVDLAKEGKTARSTIDWKPPAEAPREIREGALRGLPPEVRGLARGEEPSPAAVREILKPLLALAPLETPAGAAGEAKSGGAAQPGPEARPALFAHELKGVVVGRRRQRRLEVALMPGSLTDVSSRAYVLGLFSGVAPAGAALAVDQLMGGVISDFVRRRMLSGNLGEVFIVPKGRSFVPVDNVVFVGLGAFDRFKGASATEAGAPDAMRLVCESVVRTCLHANIEEFATVLLGASAAEDTAAAIRLFARGFVETLQAIDPQQRLRKITLCETDPRRVTELRAELIELATTDLFDEVELELRDLPKPVVSVVAPPLGARALGRRATPLYLLVRMVEPMAPPPDEPGQRRPAPSGGASEPASRIVLETSLLTPRSKAAVLTVRRELPPARKEALLDPIAREDFSPRKLEQLGHGLADFVFDEELRQALNRLADQVRDQPLVVVHDAVASQLPWEAFRFTDWVPALAGGVTRQHLDPNLSVAKWLESRVEGAVLDVLLVTNPTGDLAGAEAEGDTIRDVLKRVPNVRLVERRRSQATKPRLLADFRSGQFDVIHYAGHAFFDPAHPGRAGVICAGNEVLSGTDLAGLSGLPTLVFFNACESGRIRGRAAEAPGQTKSGARDRMHRNLSLANAFIRGGVANFLGTYWPVGDFAAKKFSETLYPLLVEGRTIGDAVLAGRRALENAGSVDWADYLLYGSPDFVLKRPSA